MPSKVDVDRGVFFYFFLLPFTFLLSYFFTFDLAYKIWFGLSGLRGFQTLGIYMHFILVAG